MGTGSVEQKARLRNKQDVNKYASPIAGTWVCWHLAYFGGWEVCMVLGASRPHFSKGDSRANPGLSDTRSVAGCRSSLEARLHIHNSQIYRGSVRGSTKYRGKRALQKPQSAEKCPPLRHICSSQYQNWSRGCHCSSLNARSWELNTNRLHITYMSILWAPRGAPSHLSPSCSLLSLDSFFFSWAFRIQLYSPHSAS